jgi:hypothetical protein
VENVFFVADAAEFFGNGLRVFKAVVAAGVIGAAAVEVDTEWFLFRPCSAMRIINAWAQALLIKADGLFGRNFGDRLLRL